MSGVTHKMAQNRVELKRRSHRVDLGMDRSDNASIMMIMMTVIKIRIT